MAALALFVSVGLLDGATADGLLDATADGLLDALAGLLDAAAAAGFLLVAGRVFQVGGQVLDFPHQEGKKHLM